MGQLVQSALDAAKRGDRNQAIDLLKQELSTNPNDIDALLAFASLIEEPTRKRQVLNRVLSLEATNKTAREAMLELDRAELNSYRAQPSSAPVSKPESQATASNRSPSSPISKGSAFADKPMVFRYSTGWLAVLYVFTSIFCCAGLLLASQDLGDSFPSLMMALLFGLTALSVSSKVEVKETGIRTSSLLKSAEIQWNEIASIKPNAMQKKLELISNTGHSVKVSTQVKGYAAIVELLRQKRPDLFAGTATAPIQQSVFPASVEQSPFLNSNPSVPTPLLTETKAFEKSFLRVYGLLFLLIPMLFLFVWLALASPEARTASLVTAAVCVLLMLIPFLQVSSIKVEPNKLTVETFFEQKEWNARQIKEIKIQAVRGRYGRVTNFVYIVPTEGKKYPLSGFSEGEEIIYGYLMNWWNAYKDR
ncbi:MAG: hypothetical protein ACM3Y8_01240 [Byssovorax cruenta]